MRRERKMWREAVEDVDLHEGEVDEELMQARIDIYLNEARRLEGAGPPWGCGAFLA